MTGEPRLLVALAVTLAPTRAAGLMLRLGDPDGACAVRLAEALAGAPRRARLAALATAVSALDPAPSPRPAPGPGTHPLLRRLERERCSPPVTGRTVVRAAAGRTG